MYDRDLVIEIISQILIAIGRIERRIERISAPNDFISSDDGIDMLDAISMMLVAIGESCKNLDRITGEALLILYPEIDWKGIKGIRDVISHHYFDINAEIVFFVCRNRIPVLKDVFKKMIKDIEG